MKEIDTDAFLKFYIYHYTVLTVSIEEIRWYPKLSEPIAYIFTVRYSPLICNFVFLSTMEKLYFSGQDKVSQEY